jgi:hypothetical protein
VAEGGAARGEEGAGAGGGEGGSEGGGSGGGDDADGRGCAAEAPECVDVEALDTLFDALEMPVG